MVLSRQPLDLSKRSTAWIRPVAPAWMRSSSSTLASTVQPPSQKFDLRHVVEDERFAKGFVRHGGISISGREAAYAAAPSVVSDLGALSRRTMRRTRISVTDFL